MNGPGQIIFIGVVAGVITHIQDWPMVVWFAITAGVGIAIEMLDQSGATK